MQFYAYQKLITTKPCPHLFTFLSKLSKVTYDNQMKFLPITGRAHGKNMIEKDDHNGTEDYSINWANFNDLTYSVWWMTLIGDFNWDGLVMVDRFMAQVGYAKFFSTLRRAPL